MSDALSVVRRPELDRKIGKKFGFRNMDGVTRPQSWCRKCRTI